MSSEQKASTLARKLANVMAAVCRVPKTGRNDYHKYDYATESDLTEAIRKHLAEQGVAVLPSVVEVKSEPLASSKRGELLTTATLEITLVCADSGEICKSRWLGQGLDAGDKGYYKAYTGAMKYFLMKTFLISTGDDPEIDDMPAPQRPKQAAPEASHSGAPKTNITPPKSTEQTTREQCIAQLRTWLVDAALGKGMNKLINSAIIHRCGGDENATLQTVAIEQLYNTTQALRLAIAEHGLETALRDLTEWAPALVEGGGGPIERSLPTPA